MSAHLNIPLILHSDKLKSSLAMTFQSEPISSKTRIVGIPKLELWIEPSRPQAQLIAYLYDVDQTGKGVFITHGPITLHTATPEQVIKVAFEDNTLPDNIVLGGIWEDSPAGPVPWNQAVFGALTEAGLPDGRLSVEANPRIGNQLAPYGTMLVYTPQRQ